MTNNFVQALLAAEGRLKGINEEQLDKFVMVERWRKASCEMSMMMSMMRLRMGIMMRMGGMRLSMRVGCKVGKF